MFRLPRLTLFLPLFALAAASVPARAQNSGAAVPSRAVDECGKPVPRARRRPATPRPSAAATQARRAEGPRVLGVPAGGSPAGVPSSTASGTDPQAPSTPTASATDRRHPPAAGAEGPRLLGVPAAGSPAAVPSSTANRTDPQRASTATASATDPRHPPAAGAERSRLLGVPAAGSPAGVPSSTANATDPQRPSAATASATDPRNAPDPRAPSAAARDASAPQDPPTAPDGATDPQTPGPENPSAAAGSPDRPIDPGAAKRNRDALRLGVSRVGDRKRLGPAASVSVPTGFGVDAGELFFGIAYQGRTRYTELSDAAAVVGIGIGTRRVLALEAALTTYSTLRGVPLETGGVSVKLHRALPHQTSVAVGWENAILWGGSDDDGSLYGVVTKLVNLRGEPDAPFSSAVFTLGVGNGRFRFEKDDAAGNQTANLFAAAGARVTPRVSLVADWTGQDLNAAASLTPLPRVPLVLTVGLADLTGAAGDGARPILSLGYGVALRQPF